MCHNLFKSKKIKMNLQLYCDDHIKNFNIFKSKLTIYFLQNKFCNVDNLMQIGVLIASWCLCLFLIFIN